MRVTVVSETYFPQVNGVSRTLGEMVRVLTERGDELQLIHPRYEDPNRDPRSITVRSIQIPFYRELRLPLPPFGHVRRAIEEFDPDIIHIATEATLGFAVLRHALKRKRLVVSSFHTNFDKYSTHYRVGWARPVIAAYLRWFHRRSRLTFVPSQVTIGELEKIGFDRLMLWKHGVDAMLFRPDRPGRLRVRQAHGFADGEVVVGYVGRIAREKNIAYLTRVLERVHQARCGVRFLVVGDGPARAGFQADIGQFATFVGYKYGEELADYYTALDIFAFASTTETFGNVVLEGMASGLPVAAIRAGGVAEIIRSGETGLLVEPDAPPEALADAVIRLVDDQAERRRMAAAAHQYALSQSWEVVMDGLRDQFQELIEAPQRGRVTTV